MTVVTRDTLSFGVTLKLFFLSVSLLHCDSVTQDTLSLSVTLKLCFFCQCPRGIVTGVTLDTLSCGVTLKLCFLSVSALHRDSVTQGTLSFGVTLKLCSFVSVCKSS